MSSFKLTGLLTGLVIAVTLGGMQVSTATEYVDGIEIDEDAVSQEWYMEENDPAFSVPEPLYGTANYIAKNISPFEFHGLRDAQYGHSGGYFVRESGTDSYFDIGFNLPTGAMFYGVTPWFYDAFTGGRVRLLIYENELSTSSSETQLHTASTTDSFAGGLTGIYAELSETGPITMKSVQAGGPHYFYRMRIQITDINTSLGFGGVALFYKLQISPAPATATFTDVPTGHTFFREIEALSASGITGGCGGGNYCPGNNVTREQMAAFLARALGLHYGY